MRCSQKQASLVMRDQSNKQSCRVLREGEEQPGTEWVWGEQLKFWADWEWGTDEDQVDGQVGVASKGSESGKVLAGQANRWLEWHQVRNWGHCDVYVSYPKVTKVKKARLPLPFPSFPSLFPGSVSALPTYDSYRSDLLLTVFRRKWIERSQPCFFSSRKCQELI